MRNKPTLTLADAHQMMAACKAEAEKNKWQVAIAILDDGGYLLHFDRMDGVGKASAEVAIGKARTAALTGRPSKFFEDRVKERPAFATFPAGLLIQGGLPIKYENATIGAVRVARGRVHEDAHIPQAGIAALK